jgi:hypothetical protein
MHANVKSRPAGRFRRIDIRKLRKASASYFSFGRASAIRLTPSSTFFIDVA